MIEIISPARFVERETLSRAVSRATQAGLTIQVSPGCHMRDGTLAGSDAARAHDFIRVWNSDVEIALCARGGYGAGRILPLIRNQLRSNGPILIGYSDITYLLSHVVKYKLGKAVHGPVPVDLQSDDKIEAFDNLLGCIAREDFSFHWQSDNGCLQEGEATGRTIVGNLTILSHLIGTPDEPQWDGAILFVEDVEEYLYAIDRIFLHLSSCGILARIAGLVLGGFTKIKDTEITFGMTIDDMALYHLRGRKIPVATDAPFGHGTQNQPIVFGAMAHMICSAGNALVEVKG